MTNVEIEMAMQLAEHTLKERRDQEAIYHQHHWPPGQVQFECGPECDELRFGTRLLLTKDERRIFRRQLQAFEFLWHLHR